jgi:hypothetical protein
LAALLVSKAMGAAIAPEAARARDAVKARRPVREFNMKLLPTLSVQLLLCAAVLQACGYFGREDYESVIVRLAADYNAASRSAIDDVT